MSSDSERSSDDTCRPEISVMRIGGHRYHDTTTVYTVGSGAEVFHADKYCSHLLNAGPDWSDSVLLTAHSLPEVLSSYLTPYKRCRHCTLSMQETVRVAVQQDGMDPVFLNYYEPGDVKVTRQVSHGKDGGRQVREWSEEIRPDGGQRSGDAEADHD